MEKEKNIMALDDVANDELLSKFFAGSAHMQVADNGFSQHVMQRLQEEMPARQRLIYNVWTVACVVSCVVMFFVSHGIDMIKGCLQSLHSSVATFGWENIQSIVSMWNAPDVTLASPLLVIVMVMVLGGVALYDMAES